MRRSSTSTASAACSPTASPTSPCSSTSEISTFEEQSLDVVKVVVELVLSWSHAMTELQRNHCILQSMHAWLHFILLKECT
uniref:Uncharacterized protein n=1 Tax=Arundo donax TaxID=35708 RepID=A0A0A8Y7E8_ARUDO